MMSATAKIGMLTYGSPTCLRPRLIPSTTAELQSHSSFSWWGEGKFGKSTIVNCLLGEEQSKVRGLPETRCFLRYVVSNRPGDKARVFLRAKRGVHDWILERVGRGIPVRELFDMLEHTVDLRTARELLDGEIDRLDRGGYEPAIYEIEREVARSRHTAFRNLIRVVDTQGLDQLFPDELRRANQGMGDDTTAERFIQWMNGSPRGKHLEWQFRRCDAVLWCVNAKRIGSASTVASLRYFAGYSKKIVIALTNIDIARSEGERTRLLDTASKKYGMYSSRIIPVNGLAAWNGISGGDERLLAESGFGDLVRVLGDVCEVEGIKVRNMSRYTGLRHTESQLRLALRALSEDYGTLKKKYELDKARVVRSLEQDWATVSDAIAQMANAIDRDVRGRIGYIEFRDDRPEVDRKLDYRTEVARLSSFVWIQINRVVLANVAAQTRLTTEYRLPAFDADGKRSGSMFSIAPEPRAAAVYIDIPNFLFVLGDWFDNAVDWMDEKFGWVAGGKDASNQRRAQRLQERWEHIDAVFAAEWRRHAENTLAQVKNETVRQYQTPVRRYRSDFRPYRATRRWFRVWRGAEDSRRTRKGGRASGIRVADARGPFVYPCRKTYEDRCPTEFNACQVRISSHHRERASGNPIHLKDITSFDGSW
jgi:hypothetical protein